MNDMGKNLLLWLIIAAVLMTVFNNFSVSSDTEELSYSAFISEVNNGRVDRVEFEDSRIFGTRKDNTNFKVILPPVPDQGLMDDLLENGVDTSSAEPDGNSFWAQLLIALSLIHI